MRRLFGSWESTSNPRNREPFVLSLAQSGLVGTLAAALAAVGMYAWSYRRHKVRLLETPTHPQQDWAMPDRCFDAVGESDHAGPRSPRAVFSFSRKDIVTDPAHRIMLTCLRVWRLHHFESFVALSFGRGFRGFRVRTFPLRQAVTSPLSHCRCLCGGYRYLSGYPWSSAPIRFFELPRAVTARRSAGSHRRFLLLWGVAPVSS